jgi:hypothetical protein
MGNASAIKKISGRIRVSVGMVRKPASLEAGEMEGY